MNQYAKSNTAKTPHKMADGGSVGLFERLAAGNIDDPTSSAYKRWGAGSKKSEPDAPAPAPAAAASEPDYDDTVNTNEFDRSTDSGDASEQTREGRRSSPTSAPKAPSKPKVKATPARSAPAASVNRQSVTGGFAGGVASGASKTASDRSQSQSEKARRHEAEMDDTPLARGVKSVGRFIKSMAPDGTGNKLPEGTKSIYADRSAPKSAPAYSGSGPGIPVDVDGWKKTKVEDDRGRRGMANGGMVGGKSYGKKC